MTLRAYLITLRGRIREALVPELQVLRSELATLRAQNYETQSLLAGAEAERDALRAQCGGKNCMGWRAPGVREWVTRERLAEVEAERDALRADAERYRWLRECARVTGEHWGGRWSLVIEGPAPGSNASPASIDAAIDAARAALKEAK